MRVERSVDRAVIAVATHTGWPRAELRALPLRMLLRTLRALTPRED